MRKMYSILVLTATMISFQSLSQFSVGLGVGVLKSTEDNSDVLFGGELAGKYDFSESFRVGLNLGWYQTTEEFFGTKFKSSLAPISISGEYLFLEEKFRPYVGVHLGLLRVGFKSGNSSNSDSYFSLAPVAGIEYQVSDNIGINANFKYGFAFYKNDFTDEIDNYSTISPNLGITYHL